MSRGSYPLDPSSPLITCERCGVSDAVMGYFDDDFAPPRHWRVCADCHDAFAGRDLAGWLRHGIPDFPAAYYPAVKDLENMTDQEARELYRKWSQAQFPDAPSHESDSESASA